MIYTRTANEKRSEPKKERCEQQNTNEKKKVNENKTKRDQQQKTRHQKQIIPKHC